jgi:hypothetical protein
MHRRPVLQRLLGQHAQARVQPCDCGRLRTRHDPVAARDRGARCGARKIERQTLPGASVRRLHAVRADGTHACLDARDHGVYALARRDVAARRRAGDYETGAREVEGPVDAQPKVARCAPVSARPRRAVDGCGEFRHPFARPCRQRKQRGVGEGGRSEQRFHLDADLLHAGGRHAVDLADRDGAVVHIEQVDDGEVLAALRHRTVVGGDRRAG